jgi:hypothetical protein
VIAFNVLAVFDTCFFSPQSEFQVRIVAWCAEQQLIMPERHPSFGQPDFALFREVPLSNELTWVFNFTFY